MIETIIDWLPEHFMISAISLLIYVIVTNSRKEKRQPAVAIAWVTGLALLPYIILPIYLIFGQRKVRLHISPPEYFPPSVKHSHWAVKVIESFKLPGAATCDINLHKDGKEALEGLYKVIDSAKYTLFLEVFIFSKDDFSKEIISKLEECQKRGVKVKVMIDAFGSFFTPKSLFKNLIKLGGEFCTFRPIFTLRYTGPVNLRNHRKLVIADSMYLWSGGRNIESNYFLGSDSTDNPWLDMSFDLYGSVAMSAAYQFDVDWANTNKSTPTYNTPKEKFTNFKTDSVAQFLPSGPDQIEDTVVSFLINALYRSENYFLAITPYFIPNIELVDAFRLAARRGVNITIVMPENSNHKTADFARSRSIRELAHNGVKIKFLPYMCHAKAYVSDDTFAMCGSVNLDERSLMINYESSVVFYSQKEIMWIKEWIERQKQNSKDYRPEKITLARDMLEGICLTIGYQL